MNRTANATESGYTSPVDSDYGTDSDMEEIARGRQTKHREEPSAPSYDGDTPGAENEEDTSENVGQDGVSGESRGGVRRQGSYRRAAPMRDGGDANAKEWCLAW